MSSLKAELKAKDIMTPEPVCVEPTTTVRQLARVFEDNEIAGAPVVDQEGRVVAVVSQTDLIRQYIESGRGFPEADSLSQVGEQDTDDEIFTEPLLWVEDIMPSHPVTVTPQTPAHYVANLMVERRIHRIVVVDHDKFPVGIITSLDVLRVFSHPARSADSP